MLPSPLGGSKWLLAQGHIQLLRATPDLNTDRAPDSKPLGLNHPSSCFFVKQDKTSVVLFTAQPSASLKSIHFGLRHSRGLGFQCALPHDDDLAPTEPACWLGEVCEVLLHCLLPVHYTVNLDHNTGSIFFNTDFILKRAETLKPVSKNLDEMPPVNLEVLELISSFSTSGQNQLSFQWTTFLAQFSFYFSS